MDSSKYTFVRRTRGISDYEIIMLQEFPKPNFEDCTDFELYLVLTCLSKKIVSAKRGKVSQEHIILVSEDHDDFPKVMERVRWSLSEIEGYRFEIGKSFTTLELYKDKKVLFEVLLEEMCIAEAMQMVTKQFTYSGTTDEKLELAQKKIQLLERSHKNLIVEKNLNEDLHCRAFLKLINAKKDRIKELEDQLKSVNISGSLKTSNSIPTTKAAAATASKKSSAKKMVLLNSSSDSETSSETDFVKKKKSGSSSDYSGDTDIEANEPQPSSSSKQQFSKKPLKKVAASPSDSLDDSFPEFTLSRKLRSTTHQLKLGGKAKRGISLEFDESNESTNKEDSKSSPSKQPKIIDVEAEFEKEKDLEVIYDADNLMDEF